MAARQDLMLLLMKGPPGSGKSPIARELGRRLGWPVIDKDVFRDLLPDHLGGVSSSVPFRCFVDEGRTAERTSSRSGRARTEPAARHLLAVGTGPYARIAASTSAAYS